MLQTKLKKNPYLIFLPFLAMYIIIALTHPTNGLHGDEGRYLIYARYMIDGFLPATDTNFDHLGDGPGYPIILIPFIALHIPLIWITILNAILLYLSIILLFKTAVKFLSFRASLIISLFWALYINSYEYIGKILPEIFALFLICLLVFSVSNIFELQKSKKYFYLSGFLVGWIALTKPIFGYVVACMLIGAVFLWVLNRGSKNYRTTVMVLLIALVTTIPYLIHTYKVTGKVFYWSTFGGTNLYWSTDLDENGYGSWFPDLSSKLDSASRPDFAKGFDEQIKQLHQKDFAEINKYNGAAQDDAFKRIALKNIQSNPTKFIQNCISNVGRLLFNFPYSYKLQTPYTLVRLPFNGLIVVLGLFCIWPTFKNWKSIDFFIRFMLILSFVYFGGSILASAETRMFTVIVPILLLSIGYILQKTLKINFIKWNT